MEQLQKKLVAKTSFFCFIAKKPSGGCALARKEYVADATALGASILQAERYFYHRKLLCSFPRKNSFLKYI